MDKETKNGTAKIIVASVISGTVAVCCFASLINPSLSENVKEMAVALLNALGLILGG